MKRALSSLLTVGKTHYAIIPVRSTRLFSMSALRSNTARILLDRVAEDTRARVVQDVVRSLTVGQSGSADFGFAAALLDLQPDAEAQAELLGHLLALIEQGDSSKVVALCEDYRGLGDALIARVCKTIATAAASFQARPGRLAVARELAVRRSSNAVEEKHDDTSIGSSQKISSFSDFVAKTPSINLEHRVELLKSSLTLLKNPDREIATSSRSVLFALFSAPGILTSENVELIWTAIGQLVASEDLFYKTLGFSIWLRWILSCPDQTQAILRQDEYWKLIVDGLRQGDGERRKACLQVLRASIDIAVQNPDLLPILACTNHQTTSPEAVSKQYSRFCTVFETVVLGRYLNQVQECEADLDFLSSEKSVVQPIWLYTLLSCALEHKMQDSNRKFVGRWILRSKLRTDDPNAYLHFFRAALLPWVAGGNLFTSTLRRHGEIVRCEHGEILSSYISNLLKTGPKFASGVIESILESILSRHGNNFAYSMAYLIDGIRQAYESTSGLTITPEQLIKLGKIPTWAGLPEVARDFILSTSWKMCCIYLERNAESSPEDIIEAARNWNKLQDKVRTLRPGCSAHVDGNVASLALDQSRRDKFEHDSIQKCVTLVERLDSTQQSAGESDLVEAIEDIWSDLEYLEYPKSLLAVLPRLMAHPCLVEAACKDSNHRLNDLIATKTLDLLELSKSRSYLLPPLVLSVREVALSKPQVAELFKLEDFILGLAESPPTPTLDAQLEEATIVLLQNLDPSLSRLNYEYYFGPRESQGFAALLDITSRLASMQTNFHKVLLDRLLERWMRQKTPPPTVSPWKTTLQLQVMLLCSDQYLRTSSVEDAKQLLRKLHYMLAIEPLPRYRYLFEWMIARAYIHHADLRRDIFAELRTKDHHSNPKFLASLMKLGVTLAKVDISDEAFALELANVFVPMAASSKVVIRHEAQWQVPVLMDHAKAKGWKSVSENVAFVELDDFIRSLAHFDDPPLERQVDKLDPVKDHNLTHLVGGPWWRLDSVEQPQMSHKDFIALYEQDKVSENILPEPCMPLGPPITTSPQTPSSTQNPPIDHTRTLLQNIDNISRSLGAGPSAPVALQTKGAAYLSTTRTLHSSLLVIASLVDNPYNLGGLSRVSEIFGAGAMYLQNTHITSHKDFTNVSVSSHNHLPILPLSASGVVEFVAEKKKKEGFKVVGIEQTDRSVLVGGEGCDLPEKCILVVGSEREGIPAVLLGECDLLVEIPQVGITRSLNVQTAAAIVLCEYAKQWRKK